MLQSWPTFYALNNDEWLLWNANTTTVKMVIFYMIIVLPYSLPSRWSYRVYFVSLITDLYLTRVLSQHVWYCIIGIILSMCPANERWCYNLTLSSIGWAHTQNDPCVMVDHVARRLHIVYCLAMISKKSDENLFYLIHWMHLRDFLTLSGLVMHICICKLWYLWFGWWLFTCLVPSCHQNH